MPRAARNAVLTAVPVGVTTLLLLALGGCAAAPEPPPPQPALTDTTQATLRQFAEVARRDAPRVTITAHTDRAGSAACNMALSQRRADALKARLVELGVAAQIIVAIGKGESQPLVQTADGVKEPQNRRADLLFD